MAKFARDQLLEMAKKNNPEAQKQTSNTENTARDQLLNMAKAAQMGTKAQPWTVQPTNKGQAAQIAQPVRPTVTQNINAQPWKTEQKENVQVLQQPVQQNPYQSYLRQYQQNQQEMQQRQVQSQRASAVSPAMFQQDQALLKQYGTYQNFVQDRKIGEMYKTPEQQRYEQVQAFQKAQAMAPVLQKQQEEQKKKEEEKAAAERAKRQQQISEPEFNRMTELQKLYGNYENYLSGQYLDTGEAKTLRVQNAKRDIGNLNQQIAAGIDAEIESKRRELNSAISAGAMDNGETPQDYRKLQDELNALINERQKMLQDGTYQSKNSLGKNAQTDNAALREQKSELQQQLDELTGRKASTGLRQIKGSVARQREQARFDKAVELHENVRELQGQRNELQQQYESANWYQKGILQMQIDQMDERINEAQRIAKQASEELYKQTSVGQFAKDAIETTVAAGAAQWLAGVDSVVGFAANGLTDAAADGMRMLARSPFAVRNQQAQNEMFDLADKLERPDFLSSAKMLQEASSGVVQSASEGRGAIGTWIMGQLPSAGAMLMDMGVSLGAGAALGSAGISAGSEGTKAILGIRAGGNAALEAKEKGATDAQAILIGIENGATEVISEMLFGGNAIYDADAGLVNKAVAKVTQNKTILSILDGQGIGGKLFDTATEGIEEVVAELLEPTFEQLVLEGNIKGATNAAEIGNAFLGGVFLSVLGNAVGVRNEVKNARYENAVKSVAQEIINEAKSVDDAAVQKAVQEMQDKLDYGRTPEAADIGAVINAMSEAGVSVDAEAAQQAAQTGTQEAILDFIEESGGKVTGKQLSDFSEAMKTAETDESMNDAYNALIDSGVLEFDEEGNIGIKEEYRNEQTDLAGSSERYAGNGTGREAGRMAEAAGAAEGRGEYGADAAGRSMGQAYGRESVRQAGVTSETDERADQARFYKEQVEKLGIEPTSPQSIGLANGIEENTVYELPERLWGKDVKSAANTAKEAGCNFRAVLGPMQLKNGKQVNAFFDEETNTIVVRADGLIRSAAQLARHESYHKLSSSDSSLNQTIRARIREKMDAAEYRRVLEEYVKAARGIYDLSDTEGEDLAEEELLADAYAGMNRFKAADATKYTETVRQSVQERTNRQTAKATENKTGPTSQKYSNSEDKKITVGMSDSERAEILRNKYIAETVYNGEAEKEIGDGADLESGKVQLVKTAFKKISEVFTPGTAQNNDMEISILYGKGVYKESASKKLTDPKQIARLAPVLNECLQNAVHFESHANKYFSDNDTTMFVNLIGGYTDGEYFVPIRFGIKQNSVGESRLYVVIDDKAIKKAGVITIVSENYSGKQEARPATYSVAKILENVNSTEILKYVPDEFLDDKKKEVKYKAITDTAKRTSDKNDEKYLEFVRKGNVNAAMNMVRRAAAYHGYVIEAWHGTRFNMDQFSKEELGKSTGTQISKKWFFAADKETAESYYPYGVMKALEKRDPKMFPEGSAEKIKNKGNLYHLFLKMENPLEVDVSDYDYAAHGEDKSALMEFSEQAEQNGNDGIILYNALDNNLKTGSRESTDYLFKNPEQAKLADTIVYDEDENIIPLSQRFNENETRFRYSESEETDNWKERQFNIIQNSNPADDDYHTWIRSAEEIRTLQETVEDPEWDYDEYDPDWTRDDAKQAIESGKVTVYSSYPIENGTFVSPSRMEAESYSGNGKIYSKTVKTNNVAWIDPTQGQYAEVNDIRYSESEEEQERKPEKLPRYAKQEAEKIRYDMMREIGADIFRDMGPVKAAIDDMAREAFQNGAISEETRQAALDAMLDNAVRFDTEMYDNYKEVRDFLRKKKIRVPEDVKAGIPDFANFRTRNFGRINLSETTGMGIDQAYMELRELAPELFPADTINLQDQLERMASVREELQQGKESEIDTSDEDFMNFVEERFKVLADGMESEIRTQKRNEEQQLDEKRRAEKARLAKEGFDGRRAEAASILNTLADRTEVGELDVGDIEPAWRIKNTREMQDIYRQYAANTPEERRLDEGLYWYMKQKVANGDMAKRKQAISTLQAAQNAQDFTRDGFKGTKALEKIGVKIARSVTGYENTEQMIARDKAAKQTARMIRKAENDLNATAKEKHLAEGIASGVMTTKDIPNTVDRSRVIELADYYLAGWSAGTDMVQQRKKDIRDNLQDVMKSLFDEFDADERVEKQSALRLNYNSTQRNAIRIFGDELGGRINKIIFDPVNQNEGERTRWLNQQMDDVREFVGKDGKKSGLTDAESALVQQVLEGASVAELVASDEMAQSIRAAADEINEGKDPADAAIAWGLGREQQQLAKKYAGWTQTVEALKDADEVKINNAVKAYQKKFNSFYDAINDFLTAHGFATIGFIKNYAPHMQTEQDQTLLTKALQAMGISTEVTELPTSIAGLTGDYKPNKRWNPYFLSRTTDITKFDIQSAYQSYVQYLSDVLYHTDDIMTMRNMVNYFRDRYAPEEIRNEIDRIQSLRNADHDAKREFLRDTGRLSMGTFPTAEEIDAAMEDALEKLYEDAKNKNMFGNFVMYLDNYANILAGKQNIADRGTEQLLGRKWLDRGRKLIYTFQKSQVAANLSSALNQSAQLANIIGDKGAIQTARAFTDILTGKCKKADFAQRSDYLTAKKGVDFLVTDKKEMIISKLFTPAEFADGLMSTIAVRAAYNEALKKGMSDKEAMLYADKYGRQVMGDRSKGGKPVAFASKNPLMQMVNVFQIEALNTWQHLAQDTLGSDFREIERTSGKKAAARAVAGVLVKTILSAFILNRLGEELYGGTPAPFDFLGLSANFIASGYGLDTNEWIRTVIDNGMEKLTGERVFDTDEIDEEFKFWSGVEDLGYNVTNDIPFVRNVAGLLGWGDETLPIPNVGDWFADVKKDAQDGMTWQDAGEDAFDLITMLAPGGRQITKTAKGIKALEKGGDYTASGRLKYTIDRSDPLTFIKAIAFGPNALTESRQYWAGGGNYQSEKSTEIYKAMKDSGMSAKDAEQFMKDMNGIEPEEGAEKAKDWQKYAFILDQDLTKEQTQTALEQVLKKETMDKLDILSLYGVEYEDYARFKVEMQKQYPGQGVSQDRAEAVIESMKLKNNAQKAALFQMVTNSEVHKDGTIYNPYSENTALQVIKDLDGMKDEE